jgi:hypothetical protein
VIVAFEDETWTSLYPKIEAEWMEKGKQREVRTPGRNKRRNVFVTLAWPKRRKNGFIFNAYARRRSREFKHHLSNLIRYAERHRARKVILFADHAPCHKTKNVKKFIREHPILKLKLLPKRAPKLNPVEYMINRPLKKVVCVNRSHQTIDEVLEETRTFLQQHKRTFWT